jgi:uncharacterized membrane protein YdbT with pleckstrin-like domain
MKSDYIEITPIRKSIFILSWKLFMIIFTLDLIYTTLLLISSQQNVDVTWHHHISLGLLFLAISKSLIQIFSILFTIFSWIQEVYYIQPQEKKLIIETGILKIKRNTYDLQNIREIIIKQNLLERFFKFGSITINTSASGGYHNTITLEKVQNPFKIENLLKTHFHNLTPNHA